MKAFLALFLAVAAPAADFVTGQAARLVVGQLSFTSADPNSTNAVIGGAAGVAYAADTLFIADANNIGAGPLNHRVLVFPNVSGTFPRATDEIPYTSLCPICVGTASVVLGQPDFVTTTENLAATQNDLREPTAVASDGIHLVVADTNHNRVLIWNHIPATNNAPADVVVGQPNFGSSTVPTNGTPSATTLRGPQGVWIQNGKLYVADTGDNRVLIYNKIPTSNGAAADVVLGQPNFTTYVQVDISQQTTTATASNLLNPVSVTSDGTHLFVSDLGYNRVLIWKTIPTTNAAPADVVVGQPDMVSSTSNNGYSVNTNVTPNVEVPVLCPVSNGTDANSNLVYPAVCNATLSYPRFALSDGTRLFISDGGNDRILEYLTIPTTNGVNADTILGQIGGGVDQATDAADSMNTPMSLAFDGTNLYCADPYNRRILVFTPSANPLAYQAVVNSASLIINASGTVTIGGTIHDGDIITITVNAAQYTYTVKSTDQFSDILNALVSSINAGTGDPNVIASIDSTNSNIVLTAKLPGAQGDNVNYTATVSTGSQVTATAAGSYLSGGGNAASVAPGTLVTISGSNLTNGTAAADLTKPQLPTKLAGAEVYFNGIQAPLTYASPTQINAQIPWEFTSTTSINAYVRTENANGTVTATSPVAVSIVSANPGVFSLPGTTPALAVAFHYSSHATAIVSVDGGIAAGDQASVTIRDRIYNYTVQAEDTLDSIRDALVAQIANDPEVSATAAGVFDRIIITARVSGPEGDGIPIAGTASAGASVTISAFDSATCCANVAGRPITALNPALPGELISVYATGLGLPVLTGGNQSFVATGVQYPVGGPVTSPQQAANAIVGGSTADVLQATLLPGSTGLFEVLLHLNPGLGTNIYTSLTVAQGLFVSNPTAIAVLSPNTQQ